MSAFSNGTEFEIWEARWCEHCSHDAGFRAELPGSPGCSVLAAGLCGEEPREWTRNATGSVVCSEFQVAAS